MQICIKKLTFFMLLWYYLFATNGTEMFLMLVYLQVTASICELGLIPSFYYIVL